MCINTYIDEEKGVLTEDDALAGAMDIIAEIVSDDAISKYYKENCSDTGVIVSCCK